MNKYTKAFYQNVIGLLPEKYSNKVNYSIQKMIGSWDLNFSNYKSPESQIHFELLKKFCVLPIEQVMHVEIGGGWDLAVPIEFYKRGITRQIIFDINPHLDYDLLLKVIEAKLSVYENKIDLQTLRQKYGIEYKIMDILDSEFENKIDFVTSTNTLEHIPRESIIKIFSFLRDNLSKDGIITSVIDFKDHYCRVDKNLSQYDYLKYRHNSLRWKFLNNKFQYINRIRFSEFESIFKTIGFNILYSERVYPDAIELQRFNNVNIHDDYKHLSLDDLKTTGMIVCLKKYSLN